MRRKIQFEVLLVRKHLLRTARRLRAATAVAAAIFVCTSTTYAQGTWTELAPDPFLPSEGMAVGSVGQVIIAAYGAFNTDHSDTNVTRLYNINTDSWSLGAPGPLPVRAEMAYGDLTHEGFLYVIGGRSSTLASAVLNNLERYDPVTNTWTTLTPMPTARAAAAAAAVDDTIYVIGGRTNGFSVCAPGPLSVVERYDIASDSWTAMAPLPTPRSDLTAIEHGGKVFVFGGCTGSTVTNEVDMYDPQTNSWTVLPPMPTARASLVVGISGDNAYAIGGVGLGAGSVNEVFSIAHESWSTDAPMPTPRFEAGAASHGARIYVEGGASAFNVGDTPANEVFKPNP